MRRAISTALLAQRLEGAGAARSADTHSEPAGRGATYELTVGLALRTVMDAMGRATRTVFVSLSIVWAHARKASHISGTEQTLHEVSLAGLI